MLRKRWRKTLLGVCPKAVQGQLVISVRGIYASTVPVPGKAETKAANFGSLGAKVAELVDTARWKQLIVTFVGMSRCVIRYGTSWCEISALHRISALCASILLG